MLISYPILSTILASAADISFVGRVLRVLNTIGTFLPMDFSKINVFPKKPEILTSLYEVVNKVAVSFTAANNTTYSFIINQQQPNGTVKTFKVTAYSDATATAAEIAAQINNLIAGYAGAGLKATSSGASTTVTIVADAGYPIFTITNLVNVTQAAAAALTQTVTSSTDANPVVVTLAAHGRSVGERVTLAGGTNSFLALAGQTFRISAVTTNTFTLEGAVGDSSGAGVGGTITLVPQTSRGQGASLIAAGITGAVSGARYTMIPFEFGKAETDSFDLQRTGSRAQTLLVLETATNYDAFITRMGEALKAFNPGAVTTDPDAVGVNP